MDELKRVGLVFKEDGSADFVKSLKLVNATLKENYENFKLTQTQWDKSTTTTQKLKDKLVYLNEAYDIQKDKVTTLKIELDELEKAENRDEVAIQKKKAALTQAETSLQRYKNQINETTNKLKTGSEAIKEYGEKVKENGEKIEKAGKKLSAFSVASVAALTASAKGAIDFESAFAGVEKTVDGTTEQMDELKKGIRNLAKEIPSSTIEISAVAEAAGQLGIKTQDILDFTKVMINLGNSTNLSADTAASSLAKFANVTNMSAKDYEKLGSTIVALGNNFATTEADIVNMAQNLASTGKQVGMSESDIMALATALSSVGLEAQAGGTAFSKALTKIQLAVETNSDDLNDWADVAGMSVKDFSKLFKEDATSALQAFIKGLSKSQGKGKSAIKVLDDMGITETRMRDALLRSANASDVFTEAIELGSNAWKENTALTNEAKKRYETLQSKMSIALNKIKDIGITLGNKLMPSIEKIITKVGEWTEKFNNLNEEQVDTIIKLGLLVAGLGPVISTIGKTTSAIGNVIQAYGNFREGLGLLITKAEASGGAMTGLLKVIQGMTSPVGLACIAIGTAITGIIIASNKANEEVKKDFETMGNSASDFIKGIDNAESHLSSFNSTLFASAEDQQELKKNMDDIQKGITDICKKASDERRGYTQEEIAQLDEYFKKLRELKDREIQIQSEIANAITQQAKTNAESFQGSLEEYKINSQEWIKTAKEQKEATVSLIEQGTIEEVALLNQRYKTEEEKQSEAYKQEYDIIMQHKQEKIDAANDEVRKVSEVYTNGYLERSKQNDGFYTKLQEFNKKLEDEQAIHNAVIDGLKDNETYTEAEKNTILLTSLSNYQKNIEKIYQDMYKNMSKEQADELGTWMGMLSQTELYGGKISDENQKMVDEIISSYESMPPETREAMKEAMKPMFDEMNKKEPALFAKAKNIADGILKNLRKAFDIHSPSKKTRKIFKQVMEGSELGLKDEEKNLYSQADDIANNINDRFGNVGSMQSLNTSLSHKGSNLDIDYEKISKAFLKALNSCKMQIDKDGLVRIVDNRLLEVM